MHSNIAIAIAMLAAWCGQASAATFYVDDTSRATPIIYVTGDVTEGDEVQLKRYNYFKHATVALASLGGDLVTGIAMGDFIHEFKWDTTVPRGGICASACSMMWMAGERRSMAPDARVGFHAAFKTNDATHAESGSGNALAGAYMAGLGYSYKTIFWATSAAPGSMHWLDATMTEASAADIGYTAEARYAVDPLPAEGLFGRMTIAERDAMFAEWQKWNSEPHGANVHIDFTKLTPAQAIAYFAWVEAQHPEKAYEPADLLNMAAGLKR